jgi:hypothetical protein
MEFAATTPQLANGSRPKQHRSRVSNGAKLLPLTDGRSASFRRYRDLFEDICADLGGIDHLSTGEQQLARRAAKLSAECERLEALSYRDPESFDVNAYGMICDRLGRLFGRLGLKRAMHDSDPPQLTVRFVDP